MSIFESMLLNYAYPCQNWTFQHFARAALKNGRNGINKKTRHSLGVEPRSSAYLAPMLNHQATGASGGTKFFSYKLSNLKFTPLPSIHMDFYSRRVVNSVFVNCLIDSVTQYSSFH